MVLSPPEQPFANPDRRAFCASPSQKQRAIIVTMASTSLIALAAMLYSGSADANDAQAHVVAVVTARATIVAGVRVDPVPDPNDPRKALQQVDVKPREQPCPENPQNPCRLIVTDLR
jgi:hypothetical protein